MTFHGYRGGQVVRRCCVAYITGAPNWYWLTVGQYLLSLLQVRAMGECFYFFCFFTFILVLLSSLSLSLISTAISFLPFSGRRLKMTHKGWRVIKPQHNQIHGNHLKIQVFILLKKKISFRMSAINLVSALRVKLIINGFNKSKLGKKY